jgi:hypothetical protein
MGVEGGPLTKTANRFLCVLSSLLLVCASLGAAVKTQEKTKVEFPGLLGGMMKFFGGKSAKEGMVNTIAVRGNRMMTVNDKLGQLVDLDEEKIYEIDFNKKRYKVMTFDEYRQRIKEAQEKMAQASGSPQQQDQNQANQKEMEVDFDVKETGQKKPVNGYDCRQIVMTVTMREKGKTLEQAGGIVLTSDMWMAPEIPEMKEVADFHRRYLEKIGLFSGSEQGAAQMAMMQQMYPAVKDAMAKFQNESADMSGTAILTVMNIEMVPGAEQKAEMAKQQQEQQQEDVNVGSVGGLLGGLGRKLGKKTEKEESNPDGRAKLMATTNEILSVSTNVSDPDVTIPADFKGKN